MSDSVSQCNLQALQLNQLLAATIKVQRTIRGHLQKSRVLVVLCNSINKSIRQWALGSVQKLLVRSDVQDYQSQVLIRVSLNISAVQSLPYRQFYYDIVKVLFPTISNDAKRCNRYHNMILRKLIWIRSSIIQKQRHLDSKYKVMRDEYTLLYNERNQMSIEDRQSYFLEACELQVLKQKESIHKAKQFKGQLEAEDELLRKKRSGTSNIVKKLSLEQSDQLLEREHMFRADCYQKRYDMLVADMIKKALDNDREFMRLEDLNMRVYYAEEAERIALHKSIEESKIHIAKIIGSNTSNGSSDSDHIQLTDSCVMVRHHCQVTLSSTITSAADIPVQLSAQILPNKLERIQYEKIQLLKCISACRIRYYRVLCIVTSTFIAKHRRLNEIRHILHCEKIGTRGKRKEYIAEAVVLQTQMEKYQSDVEVISDTLIDVLQKEIELFTRLYNIRVGDASDDSIVLKTPTKGMIGDAIDENLSGTTGKLQSKKGSLNRKVRNKKALLMMANLEDDNRSSKAFDIPAMRSFVIDDNHSLSFIRWSSKVQMHAKDCVRWMHKKEDTWKTRSKAMCMSFIQRLQYLRSAKDECVYRAEYDELHVYRMYHCESSINLLELLTYKADVSLSVTDDVGSESSITVSSDSLDRLYGKHPASLAVALLMTSDSCVQPQSDLTVTVPSILSQKDIDTMAYVRSKVHELSSIYTVTHGAAAAIDTNKQRSTIQLFTSLPAHSRAEDREMQQLVEQLYMNRSIYIKQDTNSCRLFFNSEIRIDPYSICKVSSSIRPAVPLWMLPIYTTTFNSRSDSSDSSVSIKLPSLAVAADASSKADRRTKKEASIDAIARRLFVHLRMKSLIREQLRLNIRKQDKRREDAAAAAAAKRAARMESEKKRKQQQQQQQQQQLQQQPKRSSSLLCCFAQDATIGIIADDSHGHVVEAKMLDPQPSVQVDVYEPINIDKYRSLSIDSYDCMTVSSVKASIASRLLSLNRLEPWISIREDLHTKQFREATSLRIGVRKIAVFGGVQSIYTVMQIDENSLHRERPTLNVPQVLNSSSSPLGLISRTGFLSHREMCYNSDALATLTIARGLKTLPSSMDTYNLLWKRYHCDTDCSTLNSRHATITKHLIVDVSQDQLLKQLLHIRYFDYYNGKLEHITMLQSVLRMKLGKNIVNSIKRKRLLYK